MFSQEREIQQALSELPSNIQKAVHDFNWAGEILDIANEYHIQIDDIAALQEETMLVIVGLSSADSYKERLAERMNISDDLAETLVYESNVRIFRELQKRAFSEENRGVDHEHISDHFEDEGITLLDHEEMVGAEDKAQPQIKIDSKERASEGEVQGNQSYETPSSYLEEISEDDLRGVAGHRIDTSALNTQPMSVATIIDAHERQDHEESKLVQELDKKLMTDKHISQGDRVDTSPSETEQIKEDGEYLGVLKKG